MARQDPSFMSRKRFPSRRLSRSELNLIRKILAAEKHFEKRTLPFWIQVVVTIILPIAVAFVSTYVGIRYSQEAGDESTREIAKALFPNKFLVEVDLLSMEGEKPWSEKTGLVRANPDDENKYLLKAHSKKFRLRIDVYNDEKYPATNVPIAFFYEDSAFKEKLEEFRKQIKGWKAFGTTFLEPGPMTLCRSLKKLPGIQFVDGPFDPRNHRYYLYLNLTLEADSGFFGVAVRDNLWCVRINDVK